MADDFDKQLPLVIPEDANTSQNTFLKLNRINKILETTWKKDKELFNKVFNYISRLLLEENSKYSLEQNISNAIHAVKFAQLICQFSVNDKISKLNRLTTNLYSNWMHVNLFYNCLLYKTGKQYSLSEGNLDFIQNNLFKNKEVYNLAQNSPEFSFIPLTFEDVNNEESLISKIVGDSDNPQKKSQKYLKLCNINQVLENTWKKDRESFDKVVDCICKFLEDSKYSFEFNHPPHSVMDCIKFAELICKSSVSDKKQKLILSHKALRHTHHMDYMNHLLLYKKGDRYHLAQDDLNYIRQQLTEANKEVYTFEATSREFSFIPLTFEDPMNDLFNTCEEDLATASKSFTPRK